MVRKPTKRRLRLSCGDRLASVKNLGYIVASWQLFWVANVAGWVEQAEARYGGVGVRNKT